MPRSWYPLSGPGSLFHVEHGAPGAPTITPVEGPLKPPASRYGDRRKFEHRCAPRCVPRGTIASVQARVTVVQGHRCRGLGTSLSTAPRGSVR